MTSKVIGYARRTRTGLEYFSARSLGAKFCVHPFYPTTFTQQRIRPSMASFDSFTTEQLRQEILDHGFCYQRDAVVGERVNKIAEKGFPFKTEEGLDFCKLNTFDDKASKEVSPTWLRLTIITACLCHLGVNFPMVRPGFLQSVGCSLSCIFFPQ